MSGDIGDGVGYELHEFSWAWKAMVKGGRAVRAERSHEIL